MIELVDVHKSFGRRKVLKGVSLTIERGETVAVIGLSGTGKTVTIKHIAGLLDPDSGDVLIDGTRMNGAGARVRKHLRTRMGVVFQSGALVNWMTIGDNVALPLREHRKFRPAEIDRLVEEKLKLLRIYEAKDRMPSDVSGGMRKRAGLARVLVRNPDIILYDEPTSGLDPVTSALIGKLIRQMQYDYNVTSLVVTHDMASAYYIADRIAFLYEGEIIQCDTPDRIRASENQVVQQFINGRLTGPINVD